MGPDILRVACGEQIWTLNWKTEQDAENFERCVSKKVWTDPK